MDNWIISIYLYSVLCLRVEGTSVGLCYFVCTNQENGSQVGEYSRNWPNVAKTCILQMCLVDGGEILLTSNTTTQSRPKASGITPLNRNCLHYSALKSNTLVTAHVSSNQLSPFSFAWQHCGVLIPQCWHQHLEVFLWYRSVEYVSSVKAMILFQIIITVKPSVKKNYVPSKTTWVQG